MQRTTDHEVLNLNRHIYKTTSTPKDQGTWHVLCHFLLIPPCVLFLGGDLHLMCSISSVPLTRASTVLNVGIQGVLGDLPMGIVGVFCTQQQDESSYEVELTGLDHSQRLSTELREAMSVVGIYALLGRGPSVLACCLAYKICIINTG